MTKNKYGSGHVYRRGRIWWLKYPVDGKARFESSGSERKADAEKLLRIRLGQVAAGELSGSPDTILVDTLLEDLLAHGKRQYRSFDSFWRPKIEARLMPYWKGWRACRVTTEALEAYQRHCEKAGASNATINRLVAILHRAFTLAYKSTPRKVNNIPWCPTLPERNVRTGFMEPEQYRALLAELPGELKPLLVLGYHTGARRNELLTMQRAQVDLKAGQITLHAGTTKNREGRILPIYGEMAATLERQLDSLKDFPRCRHLFHRNGEPIKRFAGSWKAACERAGLPGLLFHDLRRSAARNLCRAGVPEAVAMKITGHKTRAMFDRYNIVTGQDLADAGEKLAEFLKEDKGND